jgi:hypothetical protein
MNMEEFALRVKIEHYQPEKVEHNSLHNKYMNDHEEQEYWRSVFGEAIFELEPESNEPF